MRPMPMLRVAATMRVRGMGIGDMVGGCDVVALVMLSSGDVIVDNDREGRGGRGRLGG